MEAARSREPSAAPPNEEALDPMGPEAFRAPAAAITVAGVKYVLAPKTTLRQDHYVMSRVRKVNVEGLRGSLQTDEELERFVESFVITLYESGELYNILGGLYVQEGHEGERFTEEGAQARADRFEEATEASEKEAITSATTGVVLSFFARGLASNEISLPYLSQPDADTEREGDPSQTPSPTPLSDTSTS